MTTKNDHPKVTHCPRIISDLQYRREVSEVLWPGGHTPIVTHWPRIISDREISEALWPGGHIPIVTMMRGTVYLHIDCDCCGGSPQPAPEEKP